MPRHNYVTIQYYSKMAYSDWAMDWMILGSNPCRDKRFISCSYHPDQVWNTSRLLFKGYQGLFPGGRAARMQS